MKEQVSIKRKKLKRKWQKQRNLRKRFAINSNVNKLFDINQVLETQRRNKRLICFLNCKEYRYDSMNHLADSKPKNDIIQIDSQFYIDCLKKMFNKVKWSPEEKSFFESSNKKMKKMSCFVITGHTEDGKNLFFSDQHCKQSIEFHKLICHLDSLFEEETHEDRLIILSVCGSYEFYQRYLKKKIQIKSRLILFDQIALRLKETHFHLKPVLEVFYNCKISVAGCFKLWQYCDIHEIFKNQEYIHSSKERSNLINPFCLNKKCRLSKTRMRFSKFGLSIYYHQIQWKCDNCGFETHLPTVQFDQEKVNPLELPKGFEI